MNRSRLSVSGLVAVCLSAVLLLSGCSVSNAEGTVSQGASTTLKWGVFVPDDGAPSSDLTVVSEMAGSQPDYVLRFAALSEEVPLARLETIATSGAMPILSLEPWNPTAGTNQPDYALSTIVAGDHDADITRWADALAGLDRPMMLRFAHEMNGDWYPWALGVNGNTAAEYVAAWDHVRTLFIAAGAAKVKFVWSPNVPYGTTAAGFDDLYPGTKNVDVLGLDGYNQTGGGVGWKSASDLLGPGLDELRALPGDQPIIVTETATSEGARVGVDKARWITGLVRYLDDAERVAGFVWFQADKERDWRFNSTAEAQAAMKSALADRQK